MLSKIYRNFRRWLSKLFGKPTQRGAGESPSPSLPMHRVQGTPFAEAVPEYRTGYGHLSLLRPGERAVQELQQLLRNRGPHTGHDVIALAIGTPMRMLPHFHDFITIQQPMTNNIALLAGATCTDGDQDSLASREMEHIPWVRAAEGTGLGSVYVENPASHQIICRKIGNLATTGGNGGDQGKALLSLQTDPLSEPQLRDFIKTVYRSFLDYDALGCALVTIEGGGGSHPLHVYGVDLLKAWLTVNRHDRLFLLPTAKELLHIPNMRGTLANVLLNEANTANTLHCILRQQQTGPHDTDLAVVSGLITLSGNSVDSSHGESDPTNKFNLIAKTAGNMLSVHPRIIELPLKTVVQIGARNGHLYTNRHAISVPDALGGKRVSAILRELYSLVMEDPSAPHLITIASSLHPEEITYITKGVERFSLNQGGLVQVMCNPMFPVISPETHTAQCFLVDFRGGQGIRQLLNTFLAEKEAAPQTNRLSWEELRTVAANVAERTVTAHIEDELRRILDGNHR